MRHGRHLPSHRRGRRRLWRDPCWHELGGRTPGRGPLRNHSASRPTCHSPPDRAGPPETTPPPTRWVRVRAGARTPACPHPRLTFPLPGAPQASARTAARRPRCTSPSVSEEEWPGKEQGLSSAPGPSHATPGLTLEAGPVLGGEAITTGLAGF